MESFEVVTAGPLTAAEAERVVGTEAESLRVAVRLMRRRADRFMDRAFANLGGFRVQRDAFEGELFRAAQWRRRADEVERVLIRHGFQV